MRSRKPSRWTTPRIAPRQSIGERILRAKCDVKISGEGSSRIVFASSEIAPSESPSIKSPTPLTSFSYPCIDMAGMSRELSVEKVTDS